MALHWCLGSGVLVWTLVGLGGCALDLETTRYDAQADVAAQDASDRSDAYGLHDVSGESATGGDASDGGSLDARTDGNPPDGGPQGDGFGLDAIQPIDVPVMPSDASTNPDVPITLPDIPVIAMDVVTVVDAGVPAPDAGMACSVRPSYACSVPAPFTYTCVSLVAEMMDVATAAAAVPCCSDSDCMAATSANPCCPGQLTVPPSEAASCYQALYALFPGVCPAALYCRGVTCSTVGTTCVHGVCSNVAAGGP